MKFWENAWRMWQLSVNGVFVCMCICLREEDRKNTSSMCTLLFHLILTKKSNNFLFSQCEAKRVFDWNDWCIFRETETIMADRDIPSVPVTTLAGLASVSDCKSMIMIWIVYERRVEWWKFYWFVSVLFSVEWASDIRFVSGCATK